MELSLQQLTRALSLKKQIGKLERQLGKLFESDGSEAKLAPKRSGKRKMSAAGKARISTAQKARWAKIKGSAATPKAKKKKSGLTPAGRRKLSQNMKARWAARRKAKK
jgi:hypothetical protein